MDEVDAEDEFTDTDQDADDRISWAEFVYEFYGLDKDAVFFRWVQTSVRFSGSGSQKVLGKIGLILKLRDVKIFSKIIRKKCEKLTSKIPCLIDINCRSVKTLLF